MSTEQATNLVGNLCLFLLLCGGAIWGYHALDDAGWVLHDHTVDLYMKGNWLNGENRQCTGFQTGLGDEAHLKSLSCSTADDLDNDTPHNVSVKFWGKVSRPEMSKAGMFLFWKCTRTNDVFICKALN